MTTTIGIIGSGNIGSTVARLAVAAGLDVVTSNSRGSDSLRNLIATLGSHARGASIEDAIGSADIVMLAIPLKAYLDLPVAAFSEKIVVDAMNYRPDRDGTFSQLEGGGMTSSSLIQQHLPGARVVKAFNNVDALRLGKLARPSEAADRSAIPVAGDDPDAKARVCELIDLLGYDPVDIGSLAESWRSQPDTPVFVTPYFPPAPEGTDVDPYQWYLGSPGASVSVDKVTDLIAAATKVNHEATNRRGADA